MKVDSLLKEVRHPRCTLTMQAASIRGIRLDVARLDAAPPYSSPSPLCGESFKLMHGIPKEELYCKIVGLCVTASFSCPVYVYIIKDHLIFAKTLFYLFHHKGTKTNL